VSLKKSPTTIPTIIDLINEIEDIGYTVNIIPDQRIEIYLKLSPTHFALEILAKHALLHLAGLNNFDNSLDNETPVSVIDDEDLHADIATIENKPTAHSQGWIGEMIADFVYHFFIQRDGSSLQYKWYAIEPPKGDVTAPGLDIITAYELDSRDLGHTVGEIKTYGTLSNAKFDAYQKLIEAQDGEPKRNLEIRQALNALFKKKGDVNSVMAGKTALKNERSYLPCLLHDSSTEYKKKSTFDDMTNKFTLCTRAGQRLGIQISIDNFEEFFTKFFQQMHLLADEMHTQAAKSKQVI